MPTRRFIIVAAAAITATPSAAWAHARLVSSSPARDARVASPRSLRLTFSERMVAAFSTLEVADAAGRAVPVRVTVSDDGLTLTGVPVRRLAAGLHTVTWRIASADGHRMTGTYTFTVG